MNQDYRKAFDLLTLIADEANDGRGHGVAQMMLGQMYYEGLGVQQNLSSAREYFIKAANQGYVFAFSALSALEWRSGNYLQSIGMRVKAIWLAFCISRGDPHDWKLRRS